jgi:hypothetical protein
MAQSFLAFGLFRLSWKVQDKAASTSVHVLRNPMLAMAAVGISQWGGVADSPGSDPSTPPPSCARAPGGEGRRPGHPKCAYNVGESRLTSRRNAWPFGPHARDWRRA